MGKVGPENHNCLFKMKFKFCYKSQNCLIKIKESTKTLSNMLNSMVLFICLVLGRTYSFCANLAQKIKNICFLPWCVTFAKKTGVRKINSKL